MTPPSRYTATAIHLHWLIALALIGTFTLGLYMHELPLSPSKLKLYSWHKWVGVTLFLLACIRLAWRLGHQPPEPPADMPAWQRRASALVHGLLYLLMFAVPLSGWLMSSAKGFQTVWFGVLPLPDLIGKNEALGETLEAAHKLLNLTLAIAVGLHAAAALKHHFLDRDDVLRRMSPFPPPRS